MSRRDNSDGFPPFDENFRLQSLPPGFDTPEFNQAFREAVAFLNVAKANVATIDDLELLASRLSQLGQRIVLWVRDEVKAAERNARKTAAPKTSATIFREPKNGCGPSSAKDPHEQTATITARYSCACCQPPKRFWGKLGLYVFCGDCGSRFAADFGGA